MALKEVSIWSDAKKREEVDRFDLAMIQPILNDILVMNHKLFGTKGGLALKAQVFIYENILNVAREVWTKPFLLYHRVNKQEYQKNMLALEKLIIGEIKSTVRRMNKMAEAAGPEAAPAAAPEPAPTPEAVPEATAAPPTPEATPMPEPAPDAPLEPTPVPELTPPAPEPAPENSDATPHASSESEASELASNSDSESDCKEPMAIEDLEDLKDLKELNDLEDLNDLKESRQSSLEPEKKNKKVKSNRILRQMYLDPYLYTPQKTLRKHLKKKK